MLALSARAQIVISEIMYNPASSEDNWEWVELYNAGASTVSLAGYVLDDNNGVAHGSANIASGTIAPGGTAILYNADDITAADFAAAWGPSINLVATTNWGAGVLNNSGDQVGLWSSFASYSGDNVTHANVVVGVDFDDSSPWPVDNNSGSIYLTDLSADASDGSNWALSTVGASTPAFDAYGSKNAGGNSGDFDPSQNLLSGPDLVDPNLTNQVLSLPAGDRYSFIFRGSAQVLDHALTSTTLDPAVAGFAYGRGNADAAVDLINDDTTPLRSSDHDGLVLYLDVAPPEITVSADPIVLWPPNHKYETIAVEDFVTSISDNCTDLSVENVFVVSVTSDEEENATGGGDGNTTNDIVITDCQTVDLRAERQGGGNGRVYTITVAAEDAAGNVGTASFPVWVPHSKKDNAIDDGPAYEVLSECTAPPIANARLAEAPEDVETLEVQGIPTEFALAPNYPNPFNPTTTIEFALPEAVEVSLRVYDVTGRVVARLVERPMAAGYHQVQFNASRLASGLYLYRIQAGRFTQVRHMILVK